MNKNPQTSSPSPRKTVQNFLFTRRGGFTALLVIAVLAMAFAAISISSAQSDVQQPTAQGQATPSATPATPSQTVPLLTMQNAPQTPQCRGMLKQEILDIANGASEDPAVTFERNRRAHPHMIMMPPPVECASSLWRAARGIGGPESSADAETLRLRSYSPESLFMFGALTASVGSNINPANGVEGYQGETNIAIDPNNPLHMVAHSNTFYKDPDPGCQSPTGGSANTYGTMALFGSTDGGATWTYKCAPWPASITGGVASAVYWFGSDPALAWDNQGRAYATYMLISQSAAGASGAAIVTARSSDNGQSWQSLGTVVNGITSSTQGNDKEMMAIDNTSGQAFSHPGRIYVIWDAANSEKIAYSDNGSSWTTVNFASNTGAIGGNVVVGADGTVYAIWNRYNVETIVFCKSTDGGATWTAPAVIATMALQSFGTNNLPPAQDTRGINAFGSIDIDRNPASAFFGTLYVAFPDFPTGTTSGPDINTYVIRSTNGGTSWSSRVQVNDDNFGATQFFPWLAVDQSDGTVNVSWLDSRLDPINRKTQAVYARSSNGGVSFEPNILVTDNGANWRNNVNYADENTTDNTAYNGNQYGDYTGIAALNRQVHPLWTDSRSFFPTADTQSPTRREDNATSVITNCSAPTAISAPSVNSSTTPNVTVSWSAPAGWGTNATNGTYSVYRNTTSTFPGGSPLASGLTATNYVDTTGVVSTTYFYFVRAKNNCPGTALTPMTVDSPASASVVYGSAGTATGVLQGTVTSGGSAVSGVVVNAGTFSATTNGSGFYQFPSIGAGTYTVSSSPSGYTPASVNGVVVNGGATTVQDLSLTATGGSSCFTDTSFGDFSTGVGSNVDIAISPGDMKLGHTGGEQLDLSVTDSSNSGNGFGASGTTWWGQTFTPVVSGPLTKLDVELFCSGCTGTTSPIVVNVHNTSSNLPTGAALATATIPAFSSGVGTYYTVTFSSPATLTAGTVYAFTVHASNSISAGQYAVVRTSTNVYAAGQSVLSSNSGGTWAGAGSPQKDLEFHTYVTTAFTYPNPGNFTSAVKDSGAVTGSTPNWTTLSWTNTLPANTSVQFQVAGSNSSSGPFNFVGPNGTASTFFTTSGASLSQFNGFRYLKYKAFLATTNTANTPTLSDVTVCYNNAPITSINTTLTASPATGTYGGTVNLSATLTDGTNPLSGKSISFTLNGNSAGSATTNGSGVATVSNVSLSGINAGSYPTGVGASFAGGGGYNSSNGTAALTVNKADQTITFNALADKTYGDADFSVSATASSSLTVSFGASGSCTVTGTTVHLTGAGSCTITASQAGDTNYNAAPNVGRTFNISKANTTTTVTANNATYDGNPHGGTASVTGPAGLNQSVTVSYSGRNTTVYGPSNTAPTNAGDYTASANYAGDSNYNSSSDSKDYSIAKANQTITFNALADKTYGDADFSVSATASSGLAVSFAALGNCTVTGSTVHITGAGSCTITASQGGDSNYNAATDVARSFNIAKANQTITFNALADKTYGDADFQVSASASSGLAVSFAALGNCTVTVDMVHITGAGSCTITASQGGDANYNAAADVARSFNIAKANQTITFNALADKTYGDADFSVSASASSGLTVGFAASGDCTVTGSTVHLTGAGSCTITASQGGDSNYNAAIDVARSFDIAKANQAITFGALSDKTYGDADFSVSATASSGLTVSFAASGDCTVTGSTVHLTGAGSCTITASQGGDSNYNAASDVARSFNIAKGDQTITFNALADKTYGDSDFGVSAIASSGLSVSFAASGDCTVTGSTVHLTGAGSCTITASQGGNTNYNAATDVPRTFSTAKADTTTTVTANNATYDGNPHGGTASVTGPAGLNQSLTVTYSGRNSTVYGPSTTAPTNAGDYTASASYAGDSNYNSSNGSADYSIAQANQTITFGALSDKTYGDADFSVSATASSGLTVSFSASGNCTVTGTTVHITGGGSCTITASQGGDSNYNAAANVDRSFNIAKADQTITFAALSDKTYGDADFLVSATASSGLTVSFAAAGNCTVTGTTVHLTGAGSCTITASQGGDSNYNAATSVDRSFNIAKADQTITFAALSDKTYGDADFSVSATASSGLTVSFAAAGNCTVTGSTVHLTGAGSCTITASQGGDSNYNAATSVDRSFNIAKGTATVTLGNLSQTYDGTPKSASATTNPAGLNVTITYTPVPGAGRSPKVAGSPTNAGSYTVEATIDDPNYAGSATDTLVIAKANATINVSGYSGVYDGNSHGATGTATGAQSEDLSSLLHLGASYTNVPGGTANWTFDGDTNYNTANGSVEIEISKATPGINWSNPADIIYGTALSGTQLNASGSVPGSFVYTPAAGTVLGYGNGQNLHAAFTPTDTTNYNNATKDVSINVLSALLTTKMVVDRDPALVGYNHNYLIDIDNSGSASATSMTLSDPLPSQVRFTAVTTTQGSCAYNSGTHTVNCTLGTLGVGGNVHIQVTTKTLQPGMLDNTATVNALQWDPATGGNTTSVNDLEAIATTDVAVSKVDSADPIFVGQTTTYTIVVKNYNTPISATGVVMTDNLPASFQFVSATTSQGSLVTPPVGSTGIVTANVGTLAINGTATITITVRATAPGTITNTATASENENDSNTANNSASQSTTVNVAALQKVLLASQTLVGGCQNTTGNVYLTGPAPTGGITVNLSTTNLAGVTVPASVFIPAGQTVSAAFNVTTSPVATKQAGTVNATLGVTTVSRGLTVNVGSGTCP